MARIDLTFTARNDDKGPDDGMRLAELEDALTAARTAGALGGTRIAATVSQHRRIRSLRIEVRDDDATLPAREPVTGDAEDVRLGPRRVRDNPQA